MTPTLTRRALIQTLAVAALAARPRDALAQSGEPLYSYPIGLPDRPLGDGLLVRHGYACENAAYYPGWWHTGENWYLADGGAAGVPVYATAAGTVVFADADYPGRVVIVQHDDGLYAMYGHLDYTLEVETGQQVARGQLLGTVLARADDLARSHLHFEIRTFFTSPQINGDAPQYGVHCGYQCPPGPGYWPMDAPQHPSQLGWRNPTHVIARRAWPESVPAGAEVIVSAAAPESTALWTTLSDVEGAERVGDLALAAGARYPLLEIAAGAEDSTATSAEGYRLWYRIATPDGEGWVQAAVPIPVATGADGRPSAVRFDFLPAVMAPAP